MEQQSQRSFQIKSLLMKESGKRPEAGSLPYYASPTYAAATSSTNRCKLVQTKLKFYAEEPKDMQ